MWQKLKSKFLTYVSDNECDTESLRSADVINEIYDNPVMNYDSVSFIFPDETPYSPLLVSNLETSQNNNINPIVSEQADCSIIISESSNRMDFDPSYNLPCCSRNLPDLLTESFIADQNCVLPMDSNLQSVKNIQSLSELIAVLKVNCSIFAAGTDFNVNIREDILNRLLKVNSMSFCNLDMCDETADDRIGLYNDSEKLDNSSQLHTRISCVLSSDQNALTSSPSCGYLGEEPLSSINESETSYLMNSNDLNILNLPKEICNDHFAKVNSCNFTNFCDYIKNNICLDSDMEQCDLCQDSSDCHALYKFLVTLQAVVQAENLDRLTFVSKAIEALHLLQNSGNLNLMNMFMSHYEAWQDNQLQPAAKCLRDVESSTDFLNSLQGTSAENFLDNIEKPINCVSVDALSRLDELSVPRLSKMNSPRMTGYTLSQSVGNLCPSRGSLIAPPIAKCASMPSLNLFKKVSVPSSITNFNLLNALDLFCVSPRKPPTILKSPTVGFVSLQVDKSREQNSSDCHSPVVYVEDCDDDSGGESSCGDRVESQSLKGDQQEEHTNDQDPLTEKRVMPVKYVQLSASIMLALVVHAMQSLSIFMLEVFLNLHPHDPYK